MGVAGWAGRALGLESVLGGSEKKAADTRLRKKARPPAAPSVQSLGKGEQRQLPLGHGNPARQLWEFSKAHAFNIDSAFNMVERVSAKLDTSLQSFVHAISVTVAGGPQADLRRIWYLALAAAFGRYRNRVRGIQASDMEATWDITGKQCTVTIGYANSGTIGAINTGAGSGISSPVGMLQRGPDQITVGGSWPHWLKATTAKGAGQGFFNSIVGGWFGKGGPSVTVVGPQGFYLLKIAGLVDPQAPNILPVPVWKPVFEIEDEKTPTDYYKFIQDFRSAKNLFVEKPVGLGSRGAQLLPWSRVQPLGTAGVGRYGSVQNDDKQLPSLPDDGRLITTGQKYHPLVQNPRPPIDGKTRTGLIALVGQVLCEPGFLPFTPPAGYVPLGYGGTFAYHPGQGLEDETLNNGRFTASLQALEMDVDDILIGPTQPPVAPDGTGVDGYIVPRSVPNLKKILP